jgi:septal ring factor EnvC (AmiA/AmiB activator)
MSSGDGKSATLRYRPFGGGHRREDVEAALEKLVDTVRTVETNLEQLRVRSAELESELKTAKSELQAYRVREDRLEAAVRRAEDVLRRAEAS